MNHFSSLQGGSSLFTRDLHILDKMSDSRGHLSTLAILSSSSSSIELSPSLSTNELLSSTSTNELLSSTSTNELSPVISSDPNCLVPSISQRPLQTLYNSHPNLSWDEIELQFHYQLGGSWWTFHLHKLLKIEESSRVSQTSCANQTKSAQQRKDELDKDGDETDAKHAKRKKKSKSKSKKKSKRSHGKRNQNRGDHREENSSRSTNTELEKFRTPAYTGLEVEQDGSGFCHNLSSMDADCSTAPNGSVTNLAGENRQENDRPGMNEKSFWAQFSVCTDRSRDLEGEPQGCSMCGNHPTTSLIPCRRCETALYCCASCEKKDARRHKPVCRKIFAFITAHKSVQPILNVLQKLNTSGITRPPVSYRLASIPDGTRYKVLPDFHPPVLLAIHEGRCSEDLTVASVTVKDVTDQTTKVVVRLNSEEFTNQERVCLLQLLLPENFILIFNARWTIGAKAEDCYILLEHKAQYCIVKGVDWRKFRSRLKKIQQCTHSSSSVVLYK